LNSHSPNATFAGTWGIGMLARPETRRCIECGLPYGAIGFWCHHGDIENGPAYWSDRGILCSPKCSLAHFRRRETEGTLPAEPAPDPFMLDPDARRRR
jgi:hypothetical protein